MEIRRVKVLHIIKSLGRGGAEMLLPETLKVHNLNAFEFHYAYFLPWKDQMVKDLVSNGGRVVCFEARNNFQLLTRMSDVANYVRRHDIDIIHAHLPWAGILARIVGKRTGIPVVYTEHNKQERYHSITRLMNLLTIEMQRTILAVSEDVASSIRKYRPQLKTKLQTLVNGVNTTHFDKKKAGNSAIREKLGIPANAPVIGTVAVFRPQKRLDLWLEMAGEILKENADTHFVLVGDGPLMKTLVHRRDELGLASRVHMPGLETEIRPYLATFDVYMMSSVFEGLPVALLEAMSMNCAVITTNAGGIGEVVRHEREGLVCAVDHPKKLVEFATLLIRDDALRRKFGDRARERVATSFGMEAMVGELEGVYKRLLEG